MVGAQTTINNQLTAATAAATEMAKMTAMSKWRQRWWQRRWGQRWQKHDGSVGAAASLAVLAAVAAQQRCRQWQRGGGSAAAAAAASLVGWLELLKYEQDLWKILFEVLRSFLCRPIQTEFLMAFLILTAEQEPWFLSKTSYSNGKNRNPCRNRQPSLQIFFSCIVVCKSPHFLQESSYTNLFWNLSDSQFTSIYNF